MAQFHSIARQCCVIEFWVSHAVGKFRANSCSQAEKGRKSLMET
jgi:hypothetical protein